MSNSIRKITRDVILNDLIELGNIRGQYSTYTDFVMAVYPKASDLPVSIDDRYSCLLDEITHHMDFNKDYDDPNRDLFFKFLKLDQIEDDDFLHFLERYVNPPIKRANEDTPVDQFSKKCVEKINCSLCADSYVLKETEFIGRTVIYHAEYLGAGVKGIAKNIIFAATYKPEIIFNDALNNDISVHNEDKCLVYDEAISRDGLTWEKMVTWYANKMNIRDINCAESRYIERLRSSLDSGIERIFFESYIDLLGETGRQIPALIPQVYLYYDPLTREERGWKLFEHQKMDFMMLFSMKNRVVIELDGVQHYAEKEKVIVEGFDYPKHYASPKLYGEMMNAHRDMSLMGYDVYRFGGSELRVSQKRPKDAVKATVKDFFRRLLKKYDIKF